MVVSSVKVGVIAPAHSAEGTILNATTKQTGRKNRSGRSYSIRGRLISTHVRRTSRLTADLFSLRSVA